MLNDCSHSRFIPWMRLGLSVLAILNLVIPTLTSIVSHAYVLTSLGLKLLGFKDKSQIAFEDNVKHALFVYPDELVNEFDVTCIISCLSSLLQKYSGSKRTFSALLQKMLEKDKIGLALALVRRNATPVFCALVPQVDDVYLLSRSLTSRHILGRNSGRGRVE